jgi:Tat protein translocase TatB subunit
VDFLNVGPWELVVVLIIAILVAGPQRMLEIARSLGRVSRQLRSLSTEFTTALQSEIRAVEEEAKQSAPELADARQDLQEALAEPTETQSDAGAE